MNRLSIRLKLLVAFMILAVLVGGVSYYQIRSMQRLNGEFSHLANEDFVRLRKLQDIRFSALEMEHKTLEHLTESEHSGEEGDSHESEASVLSDKLKREIISYRERLGTHETSLSPLVDEITTEV